MGRPFAKEIHDLATYRGKLISPIQLARYVGCAKQTVYNALQKGALPHRKIGRLVRIKTVDARAWAKEDTTLQRPQEPVPPSKFPSNLNN